MNYTYLEHPIVYSCAFQGPCILVDFRETFLCLLFLVMCVCVCVCVCAYIYVCVYIQNVPGFKVNISGLNYRADGES
jgi:hypothetical protein